MIDPTSRYASLSQSPLTWTDSLGREIRFVPRRFLVPVEVFDLLGEVLVERDERLDLIAARTLGAPDAWWRIADANETLDPLRLTSEPGVRLRVPVPRA